MDLVDPVVQALEAARIDYDSENWDPDRTFADKGVDSLDFMSLLMYVDEIFGVKVSNEEANNLATPADLAVLIASRRS